jgi:hypothetical protein
MPKRIKHIVGSDAGSFVAAGPENPAAFVCANAKHKQRHLWPQVAKSEITVNPFWARPRTRRERSDCGSDAVRFLDLSS